MYAIKRLSQTAALLVIAVLFTTAPVALGDNSSRATPMKFVGTFYGLEGRVVTYGADGTVSLVNANMFSDDPNLLTAGRRTTPFLGVWRKVGNDTIEATTLSFMTEVAGFDYEDDGFIIKTTWQAKYDDPVNGVSPGYTGLGDIVVEGFTPGQNPVSDTPLFVITLPPANAVRLTQ
jgi:hypothetical protein